MAQEDIYEQVFAMMFEAFVAWVMAQPDWPVLRGLLGVLDAAYAPGFQGDKQQVADAAMQLMGAAASGGFEELAEVFEEMAQEYR